MANTAKRQLPTKKREKAHKCAWCSITIVESAQTKGGRPPRFCTDEHRSKYWNAARDKKTAKEARKKKKISANSLKVLFDGWSRTPVGFFMVSGVMRSGTTAVLPDSVESLLQLARLRINCSKACSYDRGKTGTEFELSHIVSVVKGGRLTPQNLVIAPMQRQRQHGTTSPDNAPEGLGLTKQQQEAATSVSPDGSKSCRLTRSQALAAIKSFFIKTIGRDGLKTFLKGCPKRSTSAVTSLRQNLLRQADQSLHQSINDAETVAALQQLADLNDLNYFLYQRPARDTVSVYQEELIRQGHTNSSLVSQLHLLEQSAGLEQNPPEIAFGTLEAITEALFEESFKTLHLMPTRELPSFFKDRTSLSNQEKHNAPRKSYRNNK